MKYGIVVDSSCDLMDIENDSVNVIEYSRVPLKIEVGGKEFVDDETLDTELMINEMESYKGKTGSAAPSPQSWYEAYQKSDCIFAITITSELSGSYDSAMVAKNMLHEEYPDKSIYVFDSKSTGPEMSLIVKRLIKDISQGMEFDQIIEDVNKYCSRTHLLFILESMDNLVKNGRVSKFTSGIVGLLGIKILGCASDKGTLEMLTKSRGKTNIYDKAFDEMLARGYSGSNVIISHCINPEMAEHMKQIIIEKFINAKVTIMPTRGLCSFYAERGGLIIGFEH